MKKFLRVDLPFSRKEVPPEVDASILAAAAIRAKSVRRKRMIIKLAFPGIAAAAAAITAMSVTMLPELPPARRPESTAAAERISAKLTVKPAVTEVVNTVAPAELLALADTSALEQESYNLATMSDFSVDEESLFI